MHQTFNATRRTVLAGAGAAAAMPALALVPATAGPATVVQGATPIATLWAKAAALKQQMQPFQHEIASMETRAGLPGWMHLTGAANAIGHKRYDALVAILKAPATSIEDLTLIARTTREAEIAQGPATWARFQFDAAARDFHRAA